MRLRPLALMIAMLALSACGGGGSDTTSNPPPPPPPPPPPVGCQLPVEKPDGPSTVAPWRMVVLDTAAYPSAVCNDGSPGVLFIRRNPATTRWLVWLEGGGKCVDGPSCQQRWSDSPGRMTSNLVREAYLTGNPKLPNAGVFSVNPIENPAFHDANLVQVHYCSSDVWSGDRIGNTALPSSDVRHWNFRGRTIAFAALDSLLASEGLRNATEITFGGGSAGSAGIYNLIDELKQRSPASARVIGLSDGGFQIIYPEYDRLTQTDSTVTPTPIEVIGLLGQANWGGRGDASCDAAATDDNMRANCRSAETLVRNGHISTPLLIVNTQYDINQTARLNIDINPDTGTVPNAPQAAFVRRFAARMRELLNLADAQHAVFSDYSADHVTSQTIKTQTVTVNGKLLRDAIADWHRDPCSPARAIEAEIPGQPAVVTPP